MPFTQTDLELWEQQGDVDKFRQILTLLTEPGFTEARLFSVRVLGKLRDPRGLKPLMQALEDQEEAVEKCARQALDAWAEADIDALCAMLERHEPGYYSARSLFEVIARHPGERVVQTFLKLLREGRFGPKIRETVASIEGYDRLLAQKLGQPDPEVRYYAISALKQVSHRTEVFANLISALEDECPQVRCFAANMIAAVLDNTDANHRLEPGLSVKAAASLSAHLSDEDFMVRAACASALAKSKDRSAARSLLSLLEDPYATVRESAAEALWEYAHKRMFKRLVRRYTLEPNLVVRAHLLYATAATGHSEAAGFLKTVAESEAVIELRIAALDALARTQDLQTAVPLLAKQLERREAGLTEVLLRIFDRLQVPPPVEGLVAVLADFERLDDHSIYLVLRFLSRHKERRAAKPLIEFLGHDLDNSLVKIGVEALHSILHPTHLKEYLAGLPAAEDGIYDAGVQKIQAYLAEQAESEE